MALFRGAVVAALLVGSTTVSYADDRWAPAADVRLRSELERFDDGRPSRLRLRLRLRGGAIYRPGPHTAVGVGVSTGSGAPTSAQITLGDAFSRAPLRLSEVYLAWTPVPPLTITAGKMPDPHRNRRLIWDRDVRPEGVSERFEVSGAGGARRLGLVAGQFVLVERSDARELYLLTGQVEAEHQGERLSAAVAATFYGYLGAAGIEVPYGRGDNSLSIDGTLLEDFHIGVGLAEVGWDDPHLAAHAFVEVARNVAADDAGDAATVGMRMSPGGAPVEVGYEYRWVERDAILDALAESSWHERRTGHRGHKVRIAVELGDGWRISSSLSTMRALEPPRVGQLQWLVDVRWRFRS